MTKTCCVKNCKSIWVPGGTSVSFFRVPFQNQERLNKWLSTGVEFLKLSKHSTICSHHFESTNYQTTWEGKRMLNKDALPKIHDARTSLASTDTMKVNDSSNVSCIKRTAEVSTLRLEEEKEDKEEIKELKKKKLCTVAVQTESRLFRNTEYEKILLRKIKVLQSRLRRREKRISDVEDLVNHLAMASKCTNNLEEMLLSRFSKFDIKLFSNKNRNNNATKNQKNYCSEMKEFASTLYSYSPRTYEFVRTKINLRHTATLRKWMSNFIIEPGFIESVFKYLKKEPATKEYLKNVVLIFDTMEQIHSFLSV